MTEPFARFARKDTKLKKPLLIALGCVSLALGAIGTVIPVFPTFPFLLLATACFARSSDRLHSWFVGTKLYRNNLAGLTSKEGLPWKAKVRIMVTVTVVMTVALVLLHAVRLAQIILVCVWALHILFFIFGVKTKKMPASDVRSVR